MELTWLMRLRIAGAMAVGVILIGILCRPLAAADPLGAVIAGNLDFKAEVVLVGAAFLAGLISYFIAWPYGREIGILAAPGGLSALAIRSGSMGTLLQANPTVAQRQELFAALKWEPVFWLLIVAAGFAGVLAGQKLLPRANTAENSEGANIRPAKYIIWTVSVIGSVIVAQLCLRILAQDVKVSDTRLGFVIGQPAIGQIVFAVLVSFGFVGFLAKIFLDVSYIWPSVAGSLVTALGVTVYCKQGQLEHLVESWPAVFFSNATMSILPVQMVAFGTLGSVAGYWLAVRYNYWRKNEAE